MLQVLAQLHGLPTEDGVQEEGQEDVQASSQGQDHRRPKSAGNPASHAAASSNGTQKCGRPPLAETTANNKIGLKVHLTVTHRCQYIGDLQIKYASGSATCLSCLTRGICNVLHSIKLCCRSYFSSIYLYSTLCLIVYLLSSSFAHQSSCLITVIIHLVTTVVDDYATSLHVRLLYPPVRCTASSPVHSCT